MTLTTRMYEGRYRCGTSRMLTRNEPAPAACSPGYVPSRRNRLNAALHSGATTQASASRSLLFGQAREIHDENTHTDGRKLGEAYVPVETGSPLVGLPDVQMQSM